MTRKRQEEVSLSSHHYFPGPTSVSIFYGEHCFSCCILISSYWGRSHDESSRKAIKRSTPIKRLGIGRSKEKPLWSFQSLLCCSAWTTHSSYRYDCSGTKRNSRGRSRMQRWVWFRKLGLLHLHWRARSLFWKMLLYSTGHFLLQHWQWLVLSSKRSDH